MCFPMAHLSSLYTWELNFGHLVCANLSDRPLNSPLFLILFVHFFQSPVCFINKVLQGYDYMGYKIELQLGMSCGNNLGTWGTL
jgi:hypothetical protein